MFNVIEEHKTKFDSVQVLSEYQDGILFRIKILSGVILVCHKYGKIYLSGVIKKNFEEKRQKVSDFCAE